MNGLSKFYLLANGRHVFSMLCVCVQVSGQVCVTVSLVSVASQCFYEIQCVNQLQLPLLSCLLEGLQLKHINNEVCLVVVKVKHLGEMFAHCDAVLCVCVCMMSLLN